MSVCEHCKNADEHGYSDAVYCRFCGSASQQDEGFFYCSEKENIYSVNWAKKKHFCNFYRSCGIDLFTHEEEEVVRARFPKRMAVLDGQQQMKVVSE